MSAAEVTSGVRSVGSLRIRFEERGGDGPPLLLVNGLGAGLGRWGRFRDRLASRRRVITFDPPGVGGSPAPLRPLAMPELAATALGLLEALDAPEADVLGYSFGGAVAQEMARLAPARVRRLVLAATTCGWGSPPGDPCAVTGATARVMIDGRDTTWIGLWWQALAIGAWSSMPWLGTLPQPTLVLTGARDRVVPVAAARQLAHAIPRGRLEVVPGADHWFLRRGDAGPAARPVEEFLARPSAFTARAGTGGAGEVAVGGAAQDGAGALACT